MHFEEDINRIVRFHKSQYGVDPDVLISVPGRLDFLNTHQDYKGLPVVAIAVDLRLFMALSKNRRSVFEVASLNLKDNGVEYMDTFKQLDPSLVGSGWFGDYLRASVIALSRLDYKLDGARVSIWSRIPIGSGMASSAALTVGFIFGLNVLFNLGMSPSEIAEAAYIAERSIMGIPCGRLDQYSIAYGGITLIDPREPVKVDKLDYKELPKLYIVDSKIRHKTIDVHSQRQRELNKAIEILRDKGEHINITKYIKNTSYMDVEWDKIPVSKLDDIRRLLPERLYKRIAYTILAHESTLEAIRLMKFRRYDVDKVSRWARVVESWSGIGPRYSSVNEALGVIVTYQHVLLSSLYEVSIPKIDDIVVRMLRNGAFGAKLSGAGLGGIVIGLTRHALDNDRIKGIQVHLSNGPMIHMY